MHDIQALVQEIEDLRKKGRAKKDKIRALKREIADFKRAFHQASGSDYSSKIVSALPSDAARASRYSNKDQQKDSVKMDENLKPEANRLPISPNQKFNTGKAGSS
jgi:DNA-binding GntR family transcriptional regulator